MDQREFAQVFEAIFDRCQKVMLAKSDEYSRGDKLHNFKRSAGMLNTIPEAALWGFNVKHMISIQDFINDLGRGKTQPVDKWREKITDNICYLILLEALIVERCGCPARKPKVDLDETTVGVPMPKPLDNVPPADPFPTSPGPWKADGSLPYGKPWPGVGPKVMYCEAPASTCQERAGARVPRNE